MEPASSSLAEPVALQAVPPSAPTRPLRLLVGYDGRPASRDALAFAKALADTGDADLTIASVRGYRPELLGESYGLLVKEDERWIGRGAAEVLGDTPFSVRVLAGGHDTAGLRELAETGEADIVVVGSTHRGRVGRVCPGSAGKRLLSDTPCPLAVVPRGLADRCASLGTIAVASDDSREADAALRTATALAKRTGASLRALSLADTERALTEATGIDLLVTGSRRRGGVARKLPLDGPTLRLTRTAAPCPILIVPTP